MFFMNKDFRLIKYIICKLLRASIVFIALCFFPCIQVSVFSQLSLENYIEVGSNNASQGIYSDFSTQISAQTGIFSASIGALLKASNTSENIFAAYSINSLLHLTVLKQKLSFGAFYLWKPFSVDLRETNYGVITNLKTNIIDLSIGVNARNYGFSKSAIEKYQLDDAISTNVSEPLNLMYKIALHKVICTKVNIEFRITNYDNYIIQQISNPMAMAKCNYKLNSKLQLYSELGIMQAGLLNVRINYFGFYCRGGVVWHIK